MSSPDDQVEPRYVDLMTALAHSLDHMFNNEKKGTDRDTGFVLLVFPFDDIEGPAGQGRINYISNGKREDIVIALKEILARFEGQPEIVGTA